MKAALYPPIIEIYRITFNSCKAVRIYWKSVAILSIEWAFMMVINFASNTILFEYSQRFMLIEHVVVLPTYTPTSMSI